MTNYNDLRLLISNFTKNEIGLTGGPFFPKIVHRNCKKIRKIG